MAGPSTASAAAPHLPAELSALAARVSARTHLWSSERRDVREELESHFREGLLELVAQGTPADHAATILRERFGDEHVLARLIRRAKKRGRPMSYRMIKWVFAASLGMVGATFAYSMWVAEGRPNPVVDYLALLNEPIRAIPVEQRAWPELREAILAFTPRPTALAELEALPAPGDDAWPDALAWLETNAAVYPLLQRAVAKPVYGYVYDNEEAIPFAQEVQRRRGKPLHEFDYDSAPGVIVPPTISILLPALSDFREIARLLIVDARDHADRSDAIGMWNRLDTAHRLGALALQGQTMIEQLVGSAILRLVLDEASAQLAGLPSPLPPGFAAAFEASQIATISAEHYVLRGDGERLCFHDIVQHTFTDDGDGNGRIIPTQVAALTGLSEGTDGIITLQGHADRRSTLAAFETAWQETHKLLDEPLWHNVDTDRALLDVDRERFALLRLMLPSLHRANRLIRQTYMHTEAIRVAFAVMVYRDRAGEYPQEMTALVPRDIAAIPDDLFGPQSLSYRATPRGFLLYSVGRNGVDDGGSETETPTDDGREEPLDIVLFRNYAVDSNNDN